LITIRSFKPSDTDEILKIAQVLNSPASDWSEITLRAWLKKQKCLVFWDQFIKGFVIYSLQDKVSEILAFAVNPQCQRQRIGKAIFEQYLSIIKNLDAIDEVWLELHVLNTGAQIFYQNLGFVKVGERKSYYSDGQSAVLMNFRL
jgi:ribosomal-protein-alanine N-acetyltransferase